MSSLTALPDCLNACLTQVFATTSCKPNDYDCLCNAGKTQQIDARADLRDCSSHVCKEPIEFDKFYPQICAGGAVVSSSTSSSVTVTVPTTLTTATTSAASQSSSAAVPLTTGTPATAPGGAIPVPLNPNNGTVATNGTAPNSGPPKPSASNLPNKSAAAPVRAGLGLGKTVALVVLVAGVFAGL